MGFSLTLDHDGQPAMVRALNAELHAAWVAGRIGWATLCPEDGLPNACHTVAKPPWGGAVALPEERDLGIPRGTFEAIRRTWVDYRPMPARWARP